MSLTRPIPSVVLNEATNPKAVSPNMGSNWGAQGGVVTFVATGQLTYASLLLGTPNGENGFVHTLTAASGEFVEISAMVQIFDTDPYYTGDYQFQFRMQGTRVPNGHLQPDPVTITPNRWTQVRASFSVPGGNGSLEIAECVVSNAHSNSTTLNSSNLLITRNVTSVPYFDGDSSPFEYRNDMVRPEWGGAPNASNSRFSFYPAPPQPDHSKWDSPFARQYSIGVDRGMLYVDGIGYVWPGLVSVSPEADSELEKRYIDGRLSAVIVTPADYTASMEVFTYPEEFDACLGSVRPDGPGFIVHGQGSLPFGFSYRTLVGDGDGHSVNYILHIVCDAMAEDDGRSHKTLNESPESDLFKFKIHGIPVSVNGLRPTSYFTVDSREVPMGVLRTLEAYLYGSDSASGQLPTVSELRSFLNP